MNFIFLNDSEIIEAVIGGVAFFFTIWYFREYLKWGRLKASAFIFPMVWIVRKIGVNLYKHLKRQNIFQLVTIKSKKISHFL